MRYTANYGMKEPQKNVDLADVEDLNDNFEDIDEIMHNTQISIAPAYDQTSTYDVDDLVMYENLLYKCIIAITVAEAWDSTKWERAVLSDSAGGGGGNANVTELTYNQYLALSQAEKTNGTIYMVTDDPSDSSSGGGGGGSSENYSYTEQAVGTWVDGSTIYKKTIDFGTLPNSTTKEVEAGLTNVGIVIKIEGICYLPSYFATLDSNNSSGDVGWIFGYYKGADKIRCVTNYDRSSYRAYVTIYYTKSTS